MATSSKKNKVLRGLGIGLIAGAIFFFIQIGSLKQEYEQIRQTNEARAELRLEKANFNQILGIICAIGGVTCLIFGFRKSKNI
jgi:hypothetical protein